MGSTELAGRRHTDLSHVLIVYLLLTVEHRQVTFIIEFPFSFPFVN